MDEDWCRCRERDDIATAYLQDKEEVAILLRSDIAAYMVKTVFPGTLSSLDDKHAAKYRSSGNEQEVGRYTAAEPTSMSRSKRGLRSSAPTFRHKTRERIES